MISTGFAYGERSKIADAYTKMYAPKSLMNESCKCGKKDCTECGCDEESVKKGKTSAKLPTKHKVPAKTGSKLGVRKVLPFEKRDVKSSVKKFTPKMKKVSESTRYFCIADGDRVLCTNDIGESYFNKGGTCGDMRIYESKISAMKDISKVKARRNPNSKYKVRACECIGESIQFVDNAPGHQVNEGWFDGIGNTLGNVVGGVVDAGKGIVGGAANLGKGLTNAATGLIDNTVGKIPIVGDVTNAATAGVRNVVGNVLDGVNGSIGGVADAGKGLVQNFVGGGQQPQQQQAQQKTNVQSQSGGSTAAGSTEDKRSVTGGSTAATTTTAGSTEDKRSVTGGSTAAGSTGSTDSLVPKITNDSGATNTPLTQAQTDAFNAGHGPVSQQAAEQLQKQNPTKNLPINLTMQSLPDSVKNYMNQQSGQQDNKESRRAEYQQKRKALDDQYKDVAG